METKKQKVKKMIEAGKSLNEIFKDPDFQSENKNTIRWYYNKLKKDEIK